MRNDNAKEGMIIWNLHALTGATTTQFRSKLLGDPVKNSNSNTQSWQNVKYADYLTEEGLENAKKVLLDKEGWKKQAALLFRNQTSKDLLKKLAAILRLKLKYSLKNPGKRTKEARMEFLKKNAIPYNAEYVKALSESMQNSMKGIETKFDAMDYAWFMMYLAVFKQLPNELTYVNRVRHDLAEFNDLVLVRYGTVSTPSYRYIAGLAKTGNVVALTELGELHYYGRLSLGKPQYQLAYDCFRAAAGELENPSAVHYPLACWDMAYMLFNYRFRRDLKEGVFLADLERMEMHERQELAISYCLAALRADGTFIPAFNLLGVMLDVLETTEKKDKWARKAASLIKSSDVVKTTFNKKEVIPEDLFEVAAKGGYVEACNNLARRESKKVISAARGSAEQAEHLGKAMDYLKLASQNFGTYASNKLGEFYRTGTIKVYYEEISASESVTFEEMIDDNKAVLYYKTAIEAFSDTHSAWAGYHLLKSYGSLIDEGTRMRCQEVLNIVDNKEVAALRRELSLAEYVR